MCERNCCVIFFYSADLQISVSKVVKRKARQYNCFLYLTIIDSEAKGDGLLPYVVGK